jgi:hypothetical protein
MKKLILVVCLTTFFGCKKDDKSMASIPDGIYETDRRVYAVPVTMYTSHGTITDTGIINTYLKRTYRFPQRFYSGTDQDSLPYRLTFTFQGASVTSENSLFSGSKTVDIVNKTDKILMLVQHDSSTIYSDNSSTLNCNNLWRKVQLYSPPVYNCLGNPGGVSFCKGMVQLPVEKTADGRLCIPVIGLMFNRNADVRCSIAVFGLPACFNSGVIKELQPDDTLLVQTAACFLNRK